MTVIAGAIDRDGTVFIGGDRVGTDEGRVRALASPKVRVNGDYLIGCAGTLRVAQIAHYVFKPPRPAGDLFAFMCTRFIPALRRCMKKEGGETKQGEDEVMDGTLLVGCAGRLFEIDSSYAVVEVTHPFNAVGSACQEARSAMHARRRAGAKTMVKVGLDAAAEFDINIRPPFTIESLPKKGSRKK